MKSETISERPVVKILETETKTDSLSHDFAILSPTAYKLLMAKIISEIKMRLHEYGRQVRVKKEVEDLISKVSQLTGYQTPVIRNIAVLYGLQLMSRGVKIPKNEEGYKQLLQKTSEEIEKLKTAIEISG